MDGEHITVKISAKFTKRLDELARSLGYTSRDEVVEEAVRRFLEGFEPLGDPGSEEP